MTWNVLKVAALVLLAWRRDCSALDYNCKEQGVFGPLESSMDLACWGWANKCQYVICNNYNSTTLYPSYRQCPIGMLFESSTNKCTVCPLGTMLECVDACTCEPPQPTTPVMSCTANFPFSNPYGPGKPYLKRGKCISCSEFNSSTPEWNQATQKCQPCPEGAFFNAADNSCKTCGAGQVWQTNMNRCIACPTTEPGCAEGPEQLACASWNGEYCAEATPDLNGNCPTTFPNSRGQGRPLNVGGKCIACPADAPRWNPNQGTCVACGSGNPNYNSNSNTCNRLCDYLINREVWQTTIKACVSCPATTEPNCCITCSPAQIVCARWNGVDCG